jgi:ubiquitin-like protein 4
MTTASISLIFKSAKPPASFTISVSPTDTIAQIKAQLAAEQNAPPADAQRLLLKGKALSDGKLLKEYSIKDNDVVNLMMKPGFEWDPSRSVSKALLSASASYDNPFSTMTSQPPPSLPLDQPERTSERQPVSFGSGALSPDAKVPAGGKGKRHQRIPSVVLSPSSSDTPGVEEPADILLPLDTPASLSTTPDEPMSSYHAQIAKPEFWNRLLVFLQYVSVSTLLLSDTGVLSYA